MRALFYGLALATLALVAPSAQAAKTDLVMGMVLEPPHLDPTAGAAAAIDEVVYANVFEGLTRIDRDGAVQPALAKSWTVSDDGLTYSFTLHEGVSFHDGSSLEASDVVFSLDRARAENSVNAQKALFEPIESVAAPDAATVVVTLKRPTGHFLFNLGWGDAVVVAPESADGNKAKPVGTGPFKFDRWVQGDRVELVRNPDYWGDAVELERATFKFIPDPAAAVAAMLAGDADAFANFPAPESLGQFEADPRFKVVIGSTEGETILTMNNGKAPFSDLKVRRAVAHALDRKAIIDGAMFGYGTPIGSHFAPHHPAYVDLTDRYPFDPEKAKALLAEAGLADGFKATIKLPPPTYARRGGEIIAAQLAKVGIELEIIPVEWAQWLEQVFRGKDYDLTIVSHTEPMDIGIYGRDDYYFDYQSEAFKTTLAKLDAAVEEGERYKLMAEAQRQIAEDSVNGFLFQLAKHGVWNAKLQGLWANSPVQANDLTEVSWSE
ncbi:MAG: ABC transporter substrate-binding protein [Kiloniellales bacterium]|nr:ABC transporter substrate-binding protein [Kiloniellales bacterium]MDJ0970418.1 ABC transporter substrate-binding protein [Kiloniellales bacterium]